MATYTYVCPMCGTFEVIRSMHDTTDFEPCPECSAKSPKMIASVNINSFFEGSVRKQHYIEYSGIG